MNYITEERSDALFLVQLPNFLATVTNNLPTLGLDIPDVDDLIAEIGAFDDAMENVVTTKAVAKSAVSAKNAARTIIKARIARYAKTWRANLAIPDSLLAELNVPPHQTQGSSTPPVTPTELSYSINTENVISIRWKRNGNKPGTVFNVETSSNGVSGWTVAKTTTTSKVTFNGTPGVTIYFRVVAIRNGQLATPTMPIVVWPTTGPGDVSIFEAA